MQPIERVGVFALLFLVVTVVAVVLWDKNPEEPGRTDVARREEAPARTPVRSSAGRGDRSSSPQLGGAAARTKRPSAEPEQKAIRTAPRGPAGLRGLPTSEQPKELVPAPRRRSRPQPERAKADGAGKASPGGEASEPKRSEPATPKPSLTRAPVPEPAEEPAASTSDARAGKRVHVVQSGDTLGQIALDHLGTSTRWKEIAQLNGVDASRLYVGKELLLPADARGGTTASSSKPSTPSAAGTYRVREGDSLWRIAARELGDGERWREIRDLNPKIDADRLDVGTTLAMPAGRAPRTTTVARAEPRPSSSRDSGSKRGKVR